MGHGPCTTLFDLISAKPEVLISFAQLSAVYECSFTALCQQFTETDRQSGSKVLAIVQLMMLKLRIILILS